MSNISKIINAYKSDIIEIEQSNLKQLCNLRQGIELSVECLKVLRLYLREMGDFKTRDEEIHFFKVDKPYINGRLKFFVKLHKFMLERPMANIVKQREYINKALDKLEARKMKNLEFWRYYIHEEKRLDHIYFVRGNDRLDFITDTAHFFTDPEFSTSHDNLVAQVIAYDLLTNFYQLELEHLKRKEADIVVQEVSPAILNNLSWTASKTDLIELIYALHASGAVRNGQAEISKMAEVSATLFEMDLGNVYKTYSEIKAREKDRTKFLDRLKISLLTKINIDDGK